MATTNLNVYIDRPGNYGDYFKLTWQAYSANDVAQIKRRVPYEAITNLATLKTDGYFRTNVTTNEASVGEYGGGLELPRTEKLILLAKATSTTTVTLTISHNKHAVANDKVITLSTPVVGDIFAIDLYDLGFAFNDDGNINITVAGAAITLCLIARF